MEKVTEAAAKTSSTKLENSQTLYKNKDWSPFKSRFERSCKPKISNDLCNLETVNFVYCKTRKTNIKKNPVLDDKNLKMKLKQNNSKSRESSFAKKLRKKYMPAEKISANSDMPIDNFDNPDVTSSEISIDTDAACEPENNDLIENFPVNLSKVLKIVSTKNSIPDTLETETKFNRSAIKTYSNRKKFTSTKHTVESFGLPDLPIFPLLDESPVKFNGDTIFKTNDKKEWDVNLVENDVRKTRSSTIKPEEFVKLFLKESDGKIASSTPKLKRENKSLSLDSNNVQNSEEAVEKKIFNTKKPERKNNIVKHDSKINAAEISREEMNITGISQNQIKKKIGRPRKEINIPETSQNEIKKKIGRPRKEINLADSSQEKINIPEISQNEIKKIGRSRKEINLAESSQEKINITEISQNEIKKKIGRPHKEINSAESSQEKVNITENPQNQIKKFGRPRKEFNLAERSQEKINIPQISQNEIKKILRSRKEFNLAENSQEKINIPEISQNEIKKKIGRPRKEINLADSSEEKINLTEIPQNEVKKKIGKLRKEINTTEFSEEKITATMSQSDVLKDKTLQKEIKNRIKSSDESEISQKEIINSAEIPQEEMKKKIGRPRKEIRVIEINGQTDNLQMYKSKSFVKNKSSRRFSSRFQNKVEATCNSFNDRDGKEINTDQEMEEKSPRITRSGVKSFCITEDQKKVNQENEEIKLKKEKLSEIEKIKNANQCKRELKIVLESNIFNSQNQSSKILNKTDGHNKKASLLISSSENEEFSSADDNEVNILKNKRCIHPRKKFKFNESEKTFVRKSPRINAPLTVNLSSSVDEDVHKVLSTKQTDRENSVISEESLNSSVKKNLRSCKIFKNDESNENHNISSEEKRSMNKCKLNLEKSPQSKQSKEGNNIKKIENAETAEIENAVQNNNNNNAELKSKKNFKKISPTKEKTDDKIEKITDNDKTVHEKDDFSKAVLHSMKQKYKHRDIKNKKAISVGYKITKRRRKVKYQRIFLETEMKRKMRSCTFSRNIPKIAEKVNKKSKQPKTNEVKTNSNYELENISTSEGIKTRSKYQKNVEVIVISDDDYKTMSENDQSSTKDPLLLENDCESLNLPVQDQKTPENCERLLRSGNARKSNLGSESPQIIPFLKFSNNLKKEKKNKLSKLDKRLLKGKKVAHKNKRKLAAVKNENKKSKKGKFGTKRNIIENFGKTDVSSEIKESVTIEEINKTSKDLSENENNLKIDHLTMSLEKDTVRSTVPEKETIEMDEVTTDNLQVNSKNNTSVEVADKESVISTENFHEENVLNKKEDEIILSETPTSSVKTSLTGIKTFLRFSPEFTSKNESLTAKREVERDLLQEIENNVKSPPKKKVKKASKNRLKLLYSKKNLEKKITDYFNTTNNKEMINEATSIQQNLDLSKDNKEDIVLTPFTSNSENRNEITTAPVEDNESSLREENSIDFSKGFKEGDLVWSRIGSYPYWPSMICAEPDSNKFKKTTIKKTVQTYYHVKFFADNGRRSWINLLHIMPNEVNEDMELLLTDESSKLVDNDPSTKAKLHQYYKVTKTTLPKWTEAVKEMNLLKNKSVAERLEFFNNISKNKMKAVKSNKNDETNKIVQKSSSLNFVEELTKRPERERKNYVFLPDVTSEYSDSDTQSSSKGSTASAIPHSMEEQNKLYKRNNFFKGVTRQRVCNICEKSGEVLKCKGPCGGYYHPQCTKLRIPGKENASEVDEIKDKSSETEKDNKEIKINESKNLEVKTKDSEVTMNENKNLNKPDSDDNKDSEVDQVISSSLSVDEIKVEADYVHANYLLQEMLQADVDNDDNRVEIISVCSDESDSDFSETRSIAATSSKKLTLFEQIDLKMTDVDEDVVYVDSTTEFSSEESTSNLSEPEIKLEKDIEPEESVQLETKTEPEEKIEIEPETTKETIEDTVVVSSSQTEETEIDCDNFKCSYCLLDIPPPCFVCGLETSLKGVSLRIKCSLYQCGKFYHLNCLKIWPQTQWSISNNYKLKKTDVELESFVCPSHVCHTCVSDNPRVAISRCKSDKIVKCLRCPATYHTSNLCIPAGTVIFTSSQILCPRHYGSTRKNSQPINSTWCFICSQGGDLICCETCPTSVHSECQKVNLMDDGTFICEDCESGRYPLYDEVVWAKLGSFRWWPALILFPNEVPDNVNNLVHHDGEFVVRFFGSHDHYWVNRGRVFLFQEEDKFGRSLQKRKIDQLFNKALDEAVVSYRLKKEFKTQKQSETRNGLKPPPYIKIKANKPVGNVKQLNDGNTSNTTACECNPKDPFPCGPDSVCINRLLMTECNPEICPAGNRCYNQRFEKKQYPPLEAYKTDSKGWGLRSLGPIRKGDFIIEYVGEVIDDAEYQRRIARMHEKKDENYYFLTIDKDRVIDAGPKGNLARFMNHSCQPNCETQKWTVNGDTKVGLFALDDIPAKTELTFNYNLEVVGKEKKICHCGAQNCSGFIGVKAKTETTKKSKKKVNSKKVSSTKKKSISSPSPVLNDDYQCFICGKLGNIGNFRCAYKVCNKFYHPECVSVESWPEGNKWVCPSHNCNICGKRTIRCCYMCVNSFCPMHAEGNVRHDRMLGFVCSDHDPTKASLERSTEPLETNKNSILTTTKETDITSTTDDATEAVPKNESCQVKDAITENENSETVDIETVSTTPVKSSNSSEEKLQTVTDIVSNSLLNNDKCNTNSEIAPVCLNETVKSDIDHDTTCSTNSTLSESISSNSKSRKRKRDLRSKQGTPKSLKKLKMDETGNGLDVSKKSKVHNEVDLSPTVLTRHLRTTRSSTNVTTGNEDVFVKQDNELEKDLPFRKRTTLRCGISDKQDNLM